MRIICVSFKLKEKLREVPAWESNGDCHSPLLPELGLQADAVRSSLWHLGKAAEGECSDLLAKRKRPCVEL